MPLLLGLTLTACALIYLIQQLRGRPGPGKPFPQADIRGWKVHLTPLGIVLPVAVYPFLLAWLGFLIATSLVVYGILLLLRFKTPGLSLLVGVAMTTLCYLLFARALGVVLPAGPAEVLLFKWF